MTVQEIVDLAVERSNLNDADLIPDDQMIGYVSALERQIFFIGAQGNPDYFGLEGNTTARAASTDSWDLSSAPGNIASVSKVEVAAITGSVTGVSTGDEVNVVSIRNPDDALAPRIYIRKSAAREYNEELQDDSSNFVTRLKIYYSYLPSARTSMSENVEVPTGWTNLVVVPLAKLLAIRDQRPDEIPALDQEYSLNLNLFINALGVYDEATVRELKAMAAAAPGVSVQRGS